MSPRELVGDALRRLTDGSLTFRLDEDDYTVAAMYRLDGRTCSYGWSKAALVDDCEAADIGVRSLLAKANSAAVHAE